MNRPRDRPSMPPAPLIGRSRRGKGNSSLHVSLETVVAATNSRFWCRNATITKTHSGILQWIIVNLFISMTYSGAGSGTLEALSDVSASPKREEAMEDEDEWFRCARFDYFYSLQNISFCGAHPKQLRYFGFITKHPLLPLFACHVFMSKSSTQPVVDAVGAFDRSYNEYMAFSHPTEDIYIE
ncbi:unnamed protein product [Soboliphyme baturini]|uniref:PID domain-containing protein n=1 Tax=Soboliphyme baturini TaxID=241478 RepID=A0A183IC09_9BILA|nr:unnamed protein product [Soboliphyme baturini]